MDKGILYFIPEKAGDIVSDQEQRSPLIGVLVNKNYFKSSTGVVFMRKLAQANEIAQCPLYFFTLENINWSSRKIYGHSLQFHSKLWSSRWHAFPDIIYDRGAAFRDSEKAAVEAVRRRFKKMPGIQFINSCKLEKWKVYSRLAKYSEAKKYLPETRLLQSSKDIKSMLQRHSHIFIKSSEGSGGKSVISVKKHDGRYLTKFHRSGKHQTRTSFSSHDLILLLHDLINKGAEMYVVQQGINLLKYNGRLLDLRVLLVKDRQGRWDAVYNQARVAQQGAAITSLSLGGEVMDYAAIYPQLKLNYPGIPTDDEIRNRCKLIARFIEKELGLFGEMGLDIGIDESGKLWLLEANSKPTKNPEKYIEDTRGVSPQFLMTLEYAKFLYAKK